MMRVLGAVASLLSLTLVTSAATAYEIRLVPTTPTTQVLVGQIVSFDAFIDTQGESDITLFSTSLVFDDVGFDFRQDLSDANDQLLYSPAIGKGQPATWLDPYFNPDCCDPPAQWLGSGPAQIQLNFALNRLLDQPTPGTIATATNEWVGTLAFEAVQPGAFTFEWGFGQAGNVFARSDLVDIQDQISTPVATLATVLVPEPSTALLVAVGTFALGRSARRRRAAS